MVISDHGFSSFRRGVNLNAWLQREGYLALKPGADGSAEWLRDVDWSTTRAYCVGLTGHVPEPRRAARRRASSTPGAEAAALKAEIIGEAERPARSRRASDGRHPRSVRHRDALRGPVPRQRAGPPHRLQRRLPHLVGLRDAASSPGRCSRTTSKAWSGDHCIDPRLVPGVFFCNRTIDDRRIPRSSTSRRRRCGCSASSRRRTWTAGRSTGLA